MKRYRVTVDGRTYDVEVDDPRARPVVARTAGEEFHVDVEDAEHSGGEPVVAAAPRRASIPASTETAKPPQQAGGQQRVTAPIPGTVSSISVTAGQTVSRGDALLSIEAMKMFNVIRSPWAGTIAAIHVVEGKHVTQGALLVSFLLT